MPYGLSEKTLDQLKHVFSSYDQIIEVVLYGSRAKGTHQEGSNIDLVLKGENIEFYLLQKIRNNIDNLLLHYLVDVTILSSIKNKQLIEHIERIGVIIYSKQA